MKKLILLFSLHLLMMMSCKENKKNSSEIPKTDTLSYSNQYLYKSLKYNSDSAYVSMAFPKLNGKEKITTQINEFIRLQLSMSDSVVISPENYIDSFLKSYADFCTQNKDLRIHWDEEIQVIVQTNTMNYFCFEHNRTAYTGGAHGNSFKGYSNFNRKTGNLVQLTEVINTGMYSKLTTLAEHLFRQQQHIDKNTKLEDAGFFVIDEKEKGKFRLNNNFILLKDGMQFYYNDYEIAPHAVGPSSVFIPYTKMDGILKKDFAL